jgi:hypothetical protein
MQRTLEIASLHMVGALTGASARAARAARHNVSSWAQNGSRTRWLSTEAADDNVLPLKGYRVLDMTRVLAGVRLNSLPV